MTYDHQMAKIEKSGLRALREGLLAGANGRVLEIGGGTGANLPVYGPAVESLTMTEPEIPMLRRLQRKVREQAPATTVLRAPAEGLPFEDDSFDVAVSTLVLCGVDDQPRALRELRRVLRPGGRLLFIEHVRSGDLRRARSQDRMNGFNRLVVAVTATARRSAPSRRPASLSRRSSTSCCRRSRSSFARPSRAAPRLLRAYRPGTPSSRPETGRNRNLLHEHARRQVSKPRGGAPPRQGWSGGSLGGPSPGGRRPAYRIVGINHQMLSRIPDAC